MTAIVDERWSAQLLPEGRIARSVRPLPGGFANPVWLCELDDGEDVVVKASLDDVADMFTVEAEGLRVLDERGGLRTPRVLAVRPRSLVLEALDPAVPDTVAFWEEAGRLAAHLHTTTRHDRFGWDHDGWLGLFRQRNGWDADGHRFYAEKRVLRYLSEPLVEAALEPSDRAGIERLCGRLPELIPDTGACLTHGDMWRNNVIADHAGAPAFVDPAVSYTWAEVDLAQMLRSGGVPDAFFDAYAEVRPLHADWREHTRILHIRELLAILASGLDIPGIVEGVRSLIDDYA